MITSSYAIRKRQGASAETWADYANSVLDSLLAIEFRNASSLAEATLYGSTPSVVAQPGGGIVLGANGLECSADTVLDTNVFVSEITCVVCKYSDATLGVLQYPYGAAQDESTDFYVGFIPTYPSNLHQYAFGFQSFNTVSSSQVPSATIAHIDKRSYKDGSFVYQHADNALWDTYTPSISVSIGARKSNIGGLQYSNPFTGNIEAFCIGTLKAGAEADTVAAELHTWMQTAAL